MSSTLDYTLLTLLLLPFILTFLSFTFSPTAFSTLRSAGLLITFVSMFIGLFICLSFNKLVSGFQLHTEVFILPGLPIPFGLDGVSMSFTLLTLMVFPACLLAGWSVGREIKSFFIHLLTMEVLLILAFTVTDLFYFYIFFEALLIPMFILIGGWGARARKIKAAYYFFLYTLFGSLFMLFGILYLYLLVGSTAFVDILAANLTVQQQQLLWFCFFIAFAVKMPLFPVHIWLPEAHVEAPTVGSMLLASLLLKLGGYAFFRFSILMLPAGGEAFLPGVFLLSLLGVIYGSITTIRQIDLKRIIAYSSVAHMNLVMLGLFSGTQQGLEGSIYLMLAHGFVSSALFFCIGVVYDRHHSRLLSMYGGLVITMPIFATLFFVFNLANMGFPGTSNFIGELLLFTGLYPKSSVTLIFAATSVVLAAVYSVWLYNRLVFGTLKIAYIARFREMSRREFSTLLAHLLPMVVLGLFANYALELLHLPTKTALTTALP